MTARSSKRDAERPEDALVDRRREMTLISRRIEEARTGHGCFIALSGEPGIGKTRLAQESAALAKQSGFRVFWGQCHDGQYIPPYWPWKELLRGLLGVLPSRTSARGRSISSALSPIVGEARGPEAPADAPASPETARVRILESVTQLLRLVADQGPVLLVIDNLHCADIPSLQLLQVVSREASASSIAIIGSYREPSAGAGVALRETIGALAGQAFFEGIVLSGWDLKAVRDCLRLHGGGVHLQEELAEAVHERTDGNPLFVLEVVRLLRREGFLGADRPNDHSWETHIPAKVRLAILGLFQRLSQPCRDSLAVGAVIGRGFELPLLREAWGEPGFDAAALMEEALSHGLIEEDAERPDRYRFSHALVQDVVREQVPGPRRAVLHGKVGAALERRYADDLEGRAGELARHFDAAGLDAAEKAIRYYQLAGERALRMGGYEDAHEQFVRAIELADTSGASSDTAGLLFGLARAQHGCGRIATAATTHSEAFLRYEREGRMGEAVRIFEQPLIMVEKPANLTRLLEKAIAFLGPASLPAQALGGKYALAVYHDTGDYPRAASIFAQARDSARMAGDVHQEASALTNWGRVEADELHFERALDLQDQAISLAETAEDYWVEAVARAARVVASLGMGRLEDADAHAGRLLRSIDRLQTPVWASATTMMTFALHRQRGELSEARRRNERALQLQEAPYRIWNLADRALAEYEAGDASTAAAVLDEVIRSADRAEFVFRWEGWLTLLITYIGWVTGAAVPLDAAESDARKVPKAGAMGRGDSVSLSAGLGLLAALRADRGQAARYYQELAPYTGLVVCPYLGMTADHLLAILAGVEGDFPGAHRHYETALAFCRAQSLRMELAYTCRDYAELLLRGTRQDPEKIESLCDEARPMAAAAGARRLLERIDRASDAAERPRNRRREYPDSLSEREVEVLRLLSQGLSNAQIGGRLFISLHTVANHVQSILGKTGAANRTEAATYAIRHHLSGDDSDPR